MVEHPPSWSADWAWGVPLIVLDRARPRLWSRDHLREQVVGSAHGEMPSAPLGSRVRRRGRSATVASADGPARGGGGVWALAYLALGALDDARSAMLFSLNAMTTYGHDGLGLAPHWRLMGALEALNGVILFGLTTAFLFSVASGVSRRRRAERRQRPRPAA